MSCCKCCLTFKERVVLHHEALAYSSYVVIHNHPTSPLDEICTQRQINYDICLFPGETGWVTTSFPVSVWFCHIEAVFMWTLHVFRDIEFHEAFNKRKFFSLSLPIMHCYIDKVCPLSLYEFSLSIIITFVFYVLI